MTYRGVSCRKDRKNYRYRAMIQPKTGNVHLGYFMTAKLAAKAYDIAAKKLWGLRAKLNFEGWCRATRFQLKCYKLCSPDFVGLTQRQAAQILKVTHPVICVALRRLRKKCPEIFPIYQRIPRFQRYEEWMKGVEE